MNKREANYSQRAHRMTRLFLTGLIRISTNRSIVQARGTCQQESFGPGRGIRTPKHEFLGLAASPIRISRDMVHEERFELSLPLGNWFYRPARLTVSDLSCKMEEEVGFEPTVPGLNRTLRFSGSTA